MAQCKICNFTGLLWEKRHGKLRLYDPRTKEWHDMTCQMSQEQYRAMRGNTDVCRHNVPTSKYCAGCVKEKYKKY